MDESKKPGLYFLFGFDEKKDKPKAYIGEAECISNRLKQHLEKDFWTDCTIFLNKDDNLTKGHIRYLEVNVLRSLRKLKDIY